VTLLTNLQKKVKEEGEKEEELYKKFMCYCKTGVSQLREQIDAAGEKGPQLEADIKSGEEQLKQCKQDLKTAQTERAEAKEAVAAATSIREKDAAAFADQKAELTDIISKISGAVKAIESGAAGSFLQTSTAASLKKLVDRVPATAVSDDDKVELLSFLANKQGYAPSSGEVTGILKQMLETMQGDLADATKAEESSIANFDALVAAKEAEIEAATKAVEDKLTRVGNLGVEISTMKEDLDDTQKAMIEDKKFLAELEKGCATKEAEWAERCKTRADETFTESHLVTSATSGQCPEDAFANLVLTPSCKPIVKSWNGHLRFTNL